MTSAMCCLLRAPWGPGTDEGLLKERLCPIVSIMQTMLTFLAGEGWAGGRVTSKGKF